MKVFEIMKEIREIEAMMEERVDPETGEIIYPDESDIKEKVVVIEKEKSEKIDSICYLIKEKEANAKTLKDEAKRLRDRAIIEEKAVDRLKELLKWLTDGEKQKTDKFTVYFRSSKAIEVTDESLVPADFLIFEYKINKAGAKKKLLAGEEVPGFKIEEKQSVIIK